MGPPIERWYQVSVEMGPPIERRCQMSNPLIKRNPAKFINFRPAEVWNLRLFQTLLVSVAEMNPTSRKPPKNLHSAKMQTTKKLSHKANFICETFGTHIWVLCSFAENTYWHSAVGVGSFRFVETWKFCRFASLKVKSWPPKAPDLKTGRAPSDDLGWSSEAKHLLGLSKWYLMMIYFWMAKIPKKTQLFLHVFFGL